MRAREYLRVIPYFMATTAWLFLLCSGAWAEEGTSYVGTDECLGCHDNMTSDYAASLHSRAWASMPQKHGCEACHGMGSKHIEAPSTTNIVTFGEKSANTPKEQSGQCLACHSASEEIANWDMGKHAKQGVACSSCHNIHKQYSPAPQTAEVCYRCHLDVKIDANKQSRHPLKEGKISCNDCHNPHGTLSEGQIRAESINQLCFQCHADKRGPFLWEHPPVAEDCSICHSPHGSRHKKMLTQRIPTLCWNCHSRHSADAPDKNLGFAGSTPDAMVFGRACLNCHSNIHGSWSPNRRGRKFFY